MKSEANISNQKFHALNGVNDIPRSEIETIVDLAKEENNAEVIYRLSKVLRQNPDAKTFNMTIAKYPATGLNGAQHSGDYKEALDDCGRLRPGYRFMGGKVVKVAPKQKKEAKIKQGKSPIDAVIEVGEKVGKKTPEKANKTAKKVVQVGEKVKPTKAIEKQAKTEKTILPTELKRVNFIDFEKKYKISFSELTELLSTGRVSLDKIYTDFDFNEIESNFRTFCEDFFNYKYFTNAKITSKFFVFGWDKIKVDIPLQTLYCYPVKLPVTKNALENLKNIVSKDELRPVMTGVYAEKSSYVATDAHVLVVLDAKVPDNQIGKIVNINLEKDYKEYLKIYGTDKIVGNEKKLTKENYFKKYQFIDGKYPNYKAVIPEYKSFSDLMPIEELITICTNFEKYVDKVKDTVLKVLFVSDNDVKVGLNPTMFLRVLKSLAEAGNKKIKIGISEPNRAVVIKTESNDFGLCMPMYVAKLEEENSFISETLMLKNAYNEKMLNGVVSLNSFFEKKLTGAKKNHDTYGGINHKISGTNLDFEALSDLPYHNLARAKKVYNGLTPKQKKDFKRFVEGTDAANEGLYKDFIAMVAPKAKKKQPQLKGIVQSLATNLLANSLMAPAAKSNPNSLASRMNQRANAKHEYYTVADKEIAKFLGNIEKKTKESVAITIAGGQGSMKTRFCFQLMNALAQNYKVGHASIEEHPESALYFDKAKQYCNDKALHNISAPEINSIEDVHKLTKENDVIVIDSFSKLQEMDKNCQLDKDFRKAYDGKLFIIIYQLTSDGKMRGGAKSQFDGDCIAFIEKKPNYTENYVWWDKNRYQSTPELKYNIYSGKIQKEPEPEASKQKDKPKTETFSFEIV